MYVCMYTYICIYIHMRTYRVHMYGYIIYLVIANLCGECGPTQSCQNLSDPLGCRLRIGSRRAQSCRET